MARRKDEEWDGIWLDTCMMVLERIVRLLIMLGVFLALCITFGYVFRVGEDLDIGYCVTVDREDTVNGEGVLGELWGFTIEVVFQAEL